MQYNCTRETLFLRLKIKIMVAGPVEAEVGTEEGGDEGETRQVAVTVIAAIALEVGQAQAPPLAAVEVQAVDQAVQVALARDLHVGGAHHIRKNSPSKNNNLVANIPI